MRDLRTLPKTDLHLHLEGAIRASTIVDIAARNGCEPPPGACDGRYTFDGFADFIRQYAMTGNCLRTPDDFRRVARELCVDAAAQGVAYAEVTFSPATHAVNTGDWDMPVASVLKGFDEGFASTGVRCRLVLDVIRGVPMEYCEGTLEVALRHEVVALGLGGHEGFPPEPYEHLFVRAIDAGLGSVPHAGEAEGPASIRGALRALRADRIGHGFRVLEDPELVAELRDRSVPLEVCPTSNVATGLIASLEDHPLPRLLEAGLTVTLNSDDPTMFSSPLLGEYEAARAVFGLDDHALADLARAGVRASFAEDALIGRLLNEIDGWEADA